MSSDCRVMSLWSLGYLQWCQGSWSIEWPAESRKVVGSVASGCGGLVCWRCILGSYPNHFAVPCSRFEEFVTSNQLVSVSLISNVNSGLWVVIDIYLDATGRTSREEVRELTRLSNRWASLPGRYPLLLTTFTDAAEKVM